MLVGCVRGCTGVPSPIVSTNEHDLADNAVDSATGTAADDAADDDADDDKDEDDEEGMLFVAVATGGGGGLW